MVSKLTNKGTVFLDCFFSRKGNDAQKLLAKAPNAVLSTLDLAAMPAAVDSIIGITVRDHGDGAFIHSRRRLADSDMIQDGALQDTTQNGSY